MTVRMHTGHSIEKMLHAVKAFEAAASDISIPEDQKITQFKKCLGVQARDRWDLMKSSRARRTVFTWGAAKKACISHWVADTTAKKQYCIIGAVTRNMPNQQRKAYLTIRLGSA